MKLTKLRAAPERAYKVPPCARAVELDAGTASQLIPGVRQTCGESNLDERAILARPPEVKSAVSEMQCASSAEGHAGTVGVEFLRLPCLQSAA